LVLITPGGTTLGRVELDDDETHDGAIIRRDGEPDRLVVGRVVEVVASERDGQLPVLVIERAE
jgi:hypothetical protein